MTQRVCFSISGGAFEGVEDKVSPFGYGRGEGADAGHGDPDWICSKEKPQYDQMFQALNPIDGKVTGAGTMNTLTHLHAGTLVIDKTLDALLSSTRSCSQLAELCMNFKDEDDSDHKDKIVGALSVVAHSTNMIAQFLNQSSSVLDECATSSLSIHSLDTLAIEGPSRRTGSDHLSYKGFECLADEDDDRPNCKNEFEKPGFSDDLEDVHDSDEESEDEPRAQNTYYKYAVAQCNQLFYVVKFIVLVVLNILITIVVVELLFGTMVLAITGQPWFEFTVEKFPESWVDKVKLVAFGPETETVKIQSVIELFYRHNFVNILKYFISYLRNP